MDVEDVDVVRAQLLERRLDGDVQRLDIVSGVVRLLLDVLSISLEVGCVLFAFPRAMSVSPSWTREVRPGRPGTRAPSSR